MSRALRGLPGVSSSTRQQVQDAATQLQYHPSPSASALASGRTKVIGLITTPSARWFSTAVLEGVQQVLHRHGLDLMLYPAAGHGGRARDQDIPNYRRVDGLLVLTASSAGDAVVPSRAAVPMVSIGGVVAGAPGVITDNIEVGRLATQHLIDLGHRRITFIGIGGGCATAADRFRGYQAAMRAAGTRPAEMLNPGTTATDAGLRRLLTIEPADQQRATAVVTGSDDSAIALLLGARELGWRIPTDLSIVGTDSDDLGCLFDLTTAAAPPAEQGWVAATLLLDLIAGAPPPDSTVMVHPRLLTRGTTAAIPTRTEPAGDGRPASTTREPLRRKHRAGHRKAVS